MSQIQSLIDRERTFEKEIQALKDEYETARARLREDYETRIHKLHQKLRDKENIIAEEVRKRLNTMEVSEDVEIEAPHEEQVHTILRNVITKE